SAAALLAIGRNRRALQIAGVGDRDRNLLINDQVFQLDFGGFVKDLGAALVAVLLLDLLQLFDDHVAQLLLARQDGFVFGNAIANVLQLVDDLVNRKARQAMQLQVEDGVSLDRRKRALQRRLFGLDALQVHVNRLIAEVRDQVVARFATVLTATN